MRSSLAILFAASFSTAFASVAFYDQSRNQQPVLNEVAVSSDSGVPGDNPLEYCPNYEDDGYITIEKVDLDPNPPKTGAKLNIAATGKINKEIGEGAYVNLEVKYGVITLLKQQVDLCEQIKEVQLECPLKVGNLTLTKDVDIPSQVPPGTYTVKADAYTKDDGKITCITATVSFSRSGFFGL